MAQLPLFGALPGGPEMLIILVIIVLLFGANKLPKLAHSSGQALGEFSRGRVEIERELREAKNEVVNVETDTTESTGTEIEPERSTGGARADD